MPAMQQQREQGSAARKERSALIRRVYDWAMRQSASPHAMRALGIVAFLESSIFPIPPDAMIVPMVLARPHEAWRIGLVATVASVIGGLAGYLIGYALLETVGQWIIGLYGLADRVAEYQAAYNRWGLWIILIKGLTPIPYKLVTIASGMAHFSLPVFILASILTRGMRFFLVAGLLRWYGSPIRDFIEARLTLVTTAFAALIVLGFLSIRYL
jgi:membrane protein YqaA with SNARE-associated domain